MTTTYQNPVYLRSCPDPYVLKYCAEYYCYCTGLQPDGRAFGILHSPDLVNWQPLGGAMQPLPGDHPCYWAPEVTYRDGVFYLYYSVGDETQMEIRVATATHPAGPFEDTGRRLTSEPFAIDAHVFEDQDGSWYLFYASDFLDYERIGTGTVVDRMIDPFTLAGRPRPVTRARYDWQIYHPNRPEKGGVRWHTIEGPFVLAHNGRYYQMFSGGNWQNHSYGVSYAVSERLDRPDEWPQHCDGQQVLPVLRSRPEAGVIGPGHNSVVRGPDNRQLYCIYHRWQPETDERVLALDPLGWQGDELWVDGPSTAPRPVPPPPTLAGFEAFLAAAGRWEVVGKVCRLTPEEGQTAGQVVCSQPVAGGFVLEVSLRAGSDQPQGEYGLALGRDGQPLVRVALAWPEVRVGEQRLTLPVGFTPHAFHLLRLETVPEGLKVTLDSPRLAWTLPAPGPFDQIELFTGPEAAVFTGFELTLD